MKVGVVVPTFRSGPAHSLALIDAAEAGGIDGVFFTDHLWPIGKDRGPVLSPWPLMAAAAARTQRVVVASLIARVGVVPTAELTKAFLGLREIAGSRLIAGLGVGDATSHRENLAYGLSWPDRQSRLENLEDQLSILKRESIEVWLGGRSRAIGEIGERHGVSVNKWNASPDELDTTTTWGGGVSLDADEIAQQLTIAAASQVPWAILLVKGSNPHPEAGVEAVMSARAIAAL